jgi:hypothetical protein
MQPGSARDVCIKLASSPCVAGASSYENNSKNGELIQSPGPWPAEAQASPSAEKAFLRAFI